MKRNIVIFSYTRGKLFSHLVSTPPLPKSSTLIIDLYRLKPGTDRDSKVKEKDMVPVIHLGKDFTELSRMRGNRDYSRSPKAHLLRLQNDSTTNVGSEKV